MIGQQLLARCKRGRFDSNYSATAGFKTAAMSENLDDVFRRANQLFVLDQMLNTRGSLPDALDVPKTNQPRGILRISQNGAITMIGRSYRVRDLCDNRGIVTFTHHYILYQEDRMKFLHHPEACLNIDNFDVYEQVNQRCNGLNSGNAITVNASLNLFNYPASAVSNQIFDDLGFSEDSFSALIAAICDHVSGGGRIALAAPGIGANDWEKYGGSQLGEQFLSALYAILPDCITRFLGSISYWHQPLDYTGFQGIHLFLVPDGTAKFLYKDSISLIDLNKTTYQIRNVGSYRLMGRLLWKYKDSPEQITAFHQYLLNFFGENVDSIKKFSGVMDLATQFYLMKTSGAAQDSLALLTSMLQVFGLQLPMFSKIDSACQELFDLYLENYSYSEKLEQRILSIIAMKDAKALKVYPSLIYCLLKNVQSGYACSKVVELLTQKLRNGDTVVIKQTIQLINDLQKRQELKKSNALINLLSSIYVDKEIVGQRKLKMSIFELLRQYYSAFFSAQSWDSCLMILQTCLKELSDPALPLDNRKQYYYDLFELFFAADSGCASELAPIMKREAKVLYTHEQFRGVYVEAFFHAAASYKYTLIPTEVFEPFLQLLPLVIEDTSQLERWDKFFRLIWVDTLEDSIYSTLSEITSDHCANELLHVEYLKLEFSSYKPSGTEMLAFLVSVHSAPLQKRVELFNDIISSKYTDKVGRREFLSVFSETTYYYLYYLKAVSDNDPIYIDLAETILKRPEWAKHLVQATDGAAVFLTNPIDTLYRAMVKLWNLIPEVSEVASGDHVALEKLVNLIAIQEKAVLSISLYSVGEITTKVMTGIGRVFGTIFYSQNMGSMIFEVNASVVKQLSLWINKYFWNRNFFSNLLLCYAIDSFYKTDQFPDLLDRLRRCTAKERKMSLPRIEYRSKHMKSDGSTSAFTAHCAICLLFAALQYNPQQQKANSTALELYVGVVRNNGHLPMEEKLCYLFKGFELSAYLDEYRFGAEYRRDLSHYLEDFISSTKDQNALLNEAVVKLYKKLPDNASTRELKERMSNAVLNTKSRALYSIYYISRSSSVKARNSVKDYLMIALIYLTLIIVFFIGRAVIYRLFNFFPIFGMIFGIVLCGIAAIAEIFVWLKIRS